MVPVTTNQCCSWCDNFTHHPSLCCMRPNSAGRTPPPWKIAPSGFLAEGLHCWCSAAWQRKGTRWALKISTYQSYLDYICKFGMIMYYIMPQSPQSSVRKWWVAVQLSGPQMVQPKSNKCPSLLLISNPCSPARRCSISGFCPAMSWVVHKFFTPHRVQQGMARFFIWHAMLADTDRQRWLLLICKPRMGSPSHSLVITSIIWYVGGSINEYKWGYPQFSSIWIGFSMKQAIQLLGYPHFQRQS